MVLSVILLASALAADPQPATLLPGAAPIARRTGETSWGLAGGYALASDFWDLGPQVAGVWGMTDRVALTGGLALTVRDPSAWPELGARFLVVDRPSLRVAPFAVLFGRYRLNPGDLFLFTALGVAVELGGERWRADASVPLVGYTTGASYPRGATGLPGTFLLSTLEAGVTWQFDERHAIRAGVLSVLPTLGYRWQGQRWFVEASASSLGTASAFQGRVGLGL